MCLQQDNRDLRSKGGCINITVNVPQHIKLSLRKLFYPSQSLVHTTMTDVYRLVATTSLSRLLGYTVAESKNVYNLSVSGESVFFSMELSAHDTGRKDL